MAHPIELGGMTFVSKTAAKQYIKEKILDGYPIGEDVSDPDHIAILMDVLMMKEDPARKMGEGMRFFIDDKKRYGYYVQAGTPTIAIRYSTGEPEDFGYTKTVDGAGPMQYVKDALRHEARPLHDQMRFGAFSSGSPVFSEINGEEIDSVEDSEVRYHDPSWGELTGGFVATQGGWEKIETTSGDRTGGQLGRRLVSDKVRDEWLDYHRANANPYLRHKPGH
jgi:hypothetical protein